MIRILFGGDYYQFANGDWYGVSRGKRSEYSRYFPGSHTRAPLCIYPDLLSAALTQGHDRAAFFGKKQEDEFDDITEETEKPRRKSRAKKKKKSNSISIF